ncbi:amidase [Marinovum sp. 2_MG-2023]|uniref:amidase family protein n=1 Tax=Marinovum sp. 2_MG-2023 TaxID=3062637 RepID=UPI0026E2E410|nr:amidase [Marinovum sp. 2_MG-2023]MDO6732898.1 amidase [Marinovum sp. 2_MG-2023]MDO6782172.1 amidase [Marinovum sp. 1_MG-2023]
MNTQSKTVSFEEVEAHLKAFVHLADDLDLSAVPAKTQDDLPLSQATLAVKDLFDVQGMPTGCGSPIYTGAVANQSAEVVRRAERAGVKIAGKTVTTEFATFKPGPTTNPQNMAYTPGGSSSGSAASVGAGLVSHGIGTQTAGSVIRPAAYCGVVGFLPTMGSVSRTGLKVVSPSLDRVGVFARSVSAVRRLGEEIADLPVFASLDEGPKRIGFFDDATWAEADSYTQDTLRSFKAKVREDGEIVVDLGNGQRLFDLIDAQCDVMAYEVLKSLEHELTNHSALISDQLRTYCQEAANITADQYAGALEVGQAGRLWMEALFADLDAIASPSAKTLPPKGLGSTGDPYVNRAWSLLYLPCITLPTAPLHNNLKGAVQLVAGFGQDQRLLDLAARFEPGMAQIGRENSQQEV